MWITCSIKIVSEKNVWEKNVCKKNNNKSKNMCKKNMKIKKFKNWKMCKLCKIESFMKINKSKCMKIKWVEKYGMEKNWSKIFSTKTGMDLLKINVWVPTWGKVSVYCHCIKWAMT